MNGVAIIPKIMTFRLAVENVGPLWPQLEPLIVRAIGRRPTHTADDVRHMIYGHACHPWVQMEDATVRAMAITEFASYPQGIWLRCWLNAAVPEIKQDDQAFVDAMTPWAEAHGCRGFEASGRLGWVKRFPDFVVEGVVIRYTAH